jgi:uncharacterized membrane protein YkvA (DUF1232 family)
MTEEKKNWLGPYIPQGSFIRDIVQQIKLAYSLMLDPRVNVVTKLIPFVALAYLFFPVDVSPDVVPVLGQLDDVAVLMFGLRFFFEFSPPDVVQEHLKRLAETVRGDWNVEGNPSPPTAPPSEGDVIDGSFRVDE